MTLVADTGGLYALYDADDRHHEAARTVFEEESGPVVVPLPVVAEVDYLLTRYLGADAALDFLTSLQSGAFALDHLRHDDLERISGLAARHRDLPLGFVDAAVITVAERLGADRILTVDLRDFRAVARHRKGFLILLPADRGL